MSHWNHRVVRRTYPDGSVLLDIHEAFYDDSGLVWGITEDPIAPGVEESCAGLDIPGETVEDLKKVLNWMIEACNKPILDYENIPEPGAKSPTWGEDSEDFVEW